MSRFHKINLHTNSMVLQHILSECKKRDKTGLSSFHAHSLLITSHFSALSTNCQDSANKIIYLFTAIKKKQIILYTQQMYSVSMGLLKSFLKALLPFRKMMPKASLFHSRIVGNNTNKGQLSFEKCFFSVMALAFLPIEKFIFLCYTVINTLKGA